VVLAAVVIYLREVVRGFWSVVFGTMFGAIGVIAFFWTDDRSLQALAVAALVAGLVAAPFQAFNRMRVQRDLAYGQEAHSHLRRLRLANPLSAGNWGLDSFAATGDDGLAARAVVGADHPVSIGAGFEQELMRQFEQALKVSSLERWLSARTSEQGAESWQLVTPSNDWVVTAERQPASISGEWEMYARAIAQLPRSFGGVWPVVVVDVFVRPVRAEPLPDAQYRSELSPLPPPGPARLDLTAIHALLHMLAATAVDELAPLVFTPIIERSRRDRVLARLRRREGLRLIGPNFHIRSKPHTLLEVLDMPAVKRRPGAPNRTDLFIETPESLDPFDPNERDGVIHGGVRRFLMEHEYVDVDLLHKPMAGAAADWMPRT